MIFHEQNKYKVNETKYEVKPLIGSLDEQFSLMFAESLQLRNQFRDWFRDG